MMLLNLVVAFSVEHGMPDDLVKYCKLELPKIREELAALLAEDSRPPKTAGDGI